VLLGDGNWAGREMGAVYMPDIYIKLGLIALLFVIPYCITY